MLIGYGNPLRGDDGLGPQAIERLHALLPETECMSCRQLIPELAEPLARFDLAVFIDASAIGEPGQVVVEQLSPDSPPANLTHYVHPSTLLELSRSLYGRSPMAMLVTGVGACFADREGLSPQGHKALDEICRFVPMLVRDFPAMW